MFAVRSFSGLSVEWPVKFKAFDGGA